MKGEADMIALYDGKYKEALALAKRLGDGLERQDAYRSGQYRQAVTWSSKPRLLRFKSEVYQAVHNLLTDTIKIALYTSNANLDETTTVYSTLNEVPDTGTYTAGG